jgi:capsid assembly protease
MVSGYWLLSAEAMTARAARSMLRGHVIAASKRATEPELPLTVADGVATIRVEGVLTPEPDAESAWHGEANTLYPDLQAALASANADKKVREIVWSIDSPGGMVDGLFALLDDIAEARAVGGKPMRVEAENAHSAAYGIAAAAGPITATSRMSSFGSVGVATSSFVLGDMIGKVVHLTSSDAPAKRPDVRTDEGKAVIVGYLDQIAGEFVSAIARGRGVEPETVSADYGRGASMLAKTALEHGLINGIAPRADRSSAKVVARDVRTAYAPGELMSDVKTETPEVAPTMASVPAVPAMTAEAFAELEQLRADKAAREKAEHEALVRDAEAYRKLSAVPAAVAPPATAAGTGEEALDEIERWHADQIKNPDARARYVSRRLARRNQETK